MTEAQIVKMMNTLKCSRAEAIEVIKDDEAIEKGEKLFELTAEQKKASKQATITTSGKRGYKFTKRERKPDEVKREIIETIAQNLDRACCGENLDHPQDIQIVKPEKEITFNLLGDEYSVTLIKHRKPKGE